MKGDLMAILILMDVMSAWMLDYDLGFLMVEMWLETVKALMKVGPLVIGSVASMDYC